ncbi:beta-1,3-galactosyltransferase 1-like [Haemaphysalis longicornis]
MQDGTLNTAFLLHLVVTTCPRVHFVMKAADYAFVNVPNLHRYLQMREDEERGPFMAESVVTQRPVEGDPRGPQYLPPVIYLLPTFPSHLEGYAYVMPGEATERILNTALGTPFLHLEGVFVSCAPPTPPCAHRWFFAVRTKANTQRGTLRAESRRNCTERDVNLHC